MAPASVVRLGRLAPDWVVEMIDLQRCVEIVAALPQAERLGRALWLLDRLKTGPVGHRMLSSLQTSYMLNFTRSRLLSFVETMTHDSSH